MSRQEALQVFGLGESATREDVQREYRRLMRQVHPDLGGSSYLAAKINEAKDVLS
jgi:DnaJ-class molecular chaperone